jgi:hypothetical protein
VEIAPAARCLLRRQSCRNGEFRQYAKHKAVTARPVAVNVEWEGQPAPHAQVVSVKSLDQVEHLLRGFRPDDAKDDVLIHLRAIDVQLKRLLSRKDSNCQCDCAECLAGNCADCSNPDCYDENCDANFTDAEELAALKALATSLKSLAA